MPKMTIRVILKSGSEFAIKCDKFTIQQNGFSNRRKDFVSSNPTFQCLSSRS